MTRFIGVASAVLVASAALLADQPSRAAGDHRTLFYQAGGLSLEAYLFTPSGAGPYPLVVYNVPAAAQGHALFGPQGVSIWREDVLEFLSKSLASRN
jgi:hypothetical protein